MYCPLCRYDLRALTDPRCPECGYTFTWDELRDPTRRLHDYIFEHHPQRPVWSFLRTLLAGIRPGKFWSRLHPTQPSFPRRLIWYWLITVALAFVPFALAYTSSVIIERTEVPKWRTSARGFYIQYRGEQFRHEGRSIEQELERLYPLFPSPRFFIFAIGDCGPSAFWLLVTILWPWCTLAAMLILRTSMRRAHVKISHVMRCSIYAADATVWGALIFLPMSIVIVRAILTNNLQRFYNVTLRATVPLALLGIALLMAWRLSVAYRRYLRLPHAWAVALLLQVLAWLVMLCLIGVFFAAVQRG